MNYSTMSEQTHKQCSKILSNVRPRPPSTACFQADSEPTSHSVSESESQMANSKIVVAPRSASSCAQATSINEKNISTVNVNATQMHASQPKQNENPNLQLHHVPHPPQKQAFSSIPSGNSISFVNDAVTLNTQMNSLFSGAILNIQNFNLYMK
jgi:hypothetical protein